MQLTSGSHSGPTRKRSFITFNVSFFFQLQLAVIIFPSQREDRYAAVKRVACLELALATQCIMSRTISHDAKLRSVTQKIALQINCKLGGELWALKIPITGLMVGKVLLFVNLNFV